MGNTKLMRATYFDPKESIRLTGYADTVVWDEKPRPTLVALRFGGYPEEVRGLSDAIYGGVTIEIAAGDETISLNTVARAYRRELGHDGVYAEATLIAEDDSAAAKAEKKRDAPKDAPEEAPEEQVAQDLPPRNVYIFCTPGNRRELFDAVDQKTAAPLIPEYQDYVLDELRRRGDLRPLKVRSLSRKLEAWSLRCEAQDTNIVKVLEDGLKSGAISIPGRCTDPSRFDQVNSVTDYLNTFGVTVAERIKKLFVPLFDPSKEPLSPEVLAVNQYVQEHAGYSLYDAQLAVAEAIKRRLHRGKVGLIVAECGSGKTKIGAVSIAAVAAGLHARQRAAGKAKTFNIVLCPSHITAKWVREIEETVPNAFAAVVRSITEFDQLYSLYDRGSKNCFAVISKEKARDGYMRAPAVLHRPWNREGLPIDRDPPLHQGAAIGEDSHERTFCCPSCGAVVMMDTKKNNVSYHIPADSLFFRRENASNHKCAACGGPLWTALNPETWAKQSKWGKLSDYGFIYRPRIGEHLRKLKEGPLHARIADLADRQDECLPAKGACRAYPLSSYIKRKYKGRIYGLIVDELHQYNNDSGQGDAMAELFGTAKKVVGMTATLINGYSSGIFHLLYRIAPHLMKKDGKEHDSPGRFDTEYGVVQTTCHEEVEEYNSNRRSIRSATSTRLLPGVSPLVYTRFLLETAAFLSLNDMGKELPEYEEIPVPLAMPEKVKEEYDRVEGLLKDIMKDDKRIAKKILSAYLNLLTAYPDQPYGHDPIKHPFEGNELVKAQDTWVPGDLLPKDEKVLELVRQKIAAGERVLIYTNWTRLDTQERLLKLLTEHGYQTAILPAKVKPAKREAWVMDRLDAGLQVLIANPSLVETGLDLNAFTTLVFYDTGYKLFTLRQASRRSWRINQTAPRVEVYMLYYRNTMQHKAIKLMASKLAVAGIIEGSFSEEGLAAMSECEDMTTLMAKELMLGIKDSVEDLAATFKRMALLKPQMSSWSIFTETPKEQDDTILTAAADKAATEFTFPEAPAADEAAPLQLVPEKKPAPRRGRRNEISEDQILLFKIA